MPNLIRNDTAFGAIVKSLDGLSLRSRAITNNVANVDTPGFKTTEVSFEDELAVAINRPAPDSFRMVATNTAHFGTTLRRPDIEGLAARSQEMRGLTLRNDGNNVDIDREMVRLAETQIQFSAATAFTNLKFAQLRQAIYEGRR